MYYKLSGLLAMVFLVYLVFNLPHKNSVYRECVSHDRMNTVVMCVQEIVKDNSKSCLVWYNVKLNNIVFGGSLKCSEIKVKLPRVDRPIYPKFTKKEVNV